MLDVPVDDVGDAVVKDGVRVSDACVVDPSRAIWQNSEDEIISLQRRNGNIAQRSREDDVVGDDVVLEHLLQCSSVRRCDDGSDVLESIIGGYKDGIVGEVQCVAVGTGQAKVNVETGGFEGAIQAQVAGAVGEEL